MAALEASKALSGVNTQSLTDDTDSTSATNANAAAAVGEALNGIGSTEASVSKPVAAAPAAKVKIVEADVKFIMGEMEVSKDTATQALRRAGGSKVEALRLLVLGK